MSRPRDTSPPVTLFSFQDIITSICGIMILIVMNFAIKMSEARATGGAPEAPEKTAGADRSKEIEERKAYLRGLQTGQFEQIRQARLIQERNAQQISMDRAKKILAALHTKGTELEGQVRTLSNTVEKAQTALREQKQGRMVRFVPGRGELEPVIVECSVRGAVCAAVNDQQAPREFTRQALDDFLAYARQVDKTKRYFLFMIRPSGADFAREWAEHVRRTGYGVGWDALEDGPVIDFGLRAQ
jgi:hypothetical protein